MGSIHVQVKANCLAVALLLEDKALGRPCQQRAAGVVW